MEKKLPIGMTDFRKLIETNCYYVDKTKFIEDILQDGAEVNLFTRPRRFGKSINLSMLKYFFNKVGVAELERNRNLFRGLYIEKSLAFSKQGKYPVIYISFKDIKSNSFEEAIEDIKNIMFRLFNEFSYIKERLNEAEKNVFDISWLMKGNISQLKFSLKNLCDFLEKYYSEKVIILIDEYDTPLVNAYEKGYYYDMLNFFKVFYSSALKDNDSLKFGIMTGIIKVTQAGIFSDLNNLKINNILSNNYDEYFGFTEKEVNEILSNFSIKRDKKKEVKNWYNGYKFGEKEIYNPWSILNFISEKKTLSFWLNTSDNFLIKDILKKADNELFEDLKKLFSGDSIIKTVEQNLNLKDNLENNDIWNLMLYSGYLTINQNIVDNTYALKIPNMEIRKFFKEKFIDIFLGGENTIKNIEKALETLSQDENGSSNLELEFSKILMKYPSYFDLENNEKIYHILILGIMIGFDSNYIVLSNRESGHGRYDLYIKNIKTQISYIFEFKVAETEEKLNNSVDEAITQIEKQEYFSSFQEDKVIYGIGMAFYKKRVKLKYLKIRFK